MHPVPGSASIWDWVTQVIFDFCSLVETDGNGPQGGYRDERIVDIGTST